MAMMMMTIICCRGSYEAAALLILPFFIFSLALIAVTLFPSDQPARARNNSPVKCVIHIQQILYKKPTEEEPHIDPSSIAPTSYAPSLSYSFADRR
jgi:hypothetical protein